MPVMFMSHAPRPLCILNLDLVLGGEEFWKIKIIFKTKCEKLPFY